MPNFGVNSAVNACATGVGGLVPLRLCLNADSSKKGSMPPQIADHSAQGGAYKSVSSRPPSGSTRSPTMASVAHLAECLTATLDSNPNVRISAELKLAELSAQPGSWSMLQCATLD